MQICILFEYKNGDYFIYHAHLRHLYSYVFQICTHVGDIQHVCDLKAHSEAHSEIYIIPFKPKLDLAGHM